MILEGKTTFLVPLLLRELKEVISELFRVLLANIFKIPERGLLARRVNPLPTGDWSRPTPSQTWPIGQVAKHARSLD